MVPVPATEVLRREATFSAEGTRPTSLDAYNEALDELARLTPKAHR